MAPEAASAPAPPPGPEAALTAPSEDEIGSTDKGISRENGSRTELRTKVEKYAESHLNALTAVLEEAPASVESALQQAIYVSEAGYRKALAAMD